jgi:hypothetical protein
MLDYSKDEERQLCRLHIALMDRMGVKVDRFGDAEKSLAELGEQCGPCHHTRILR